MEYSIDRDRGFYHKAFRNRHPQHSLYDQSGSGLPVFRGNRYQKGYGLGGILGGFFKTILRASKPLLKAAGKRALKGGINVISNLGSGTPIKKAIINETKKGFQDLGKKGVPLLLNSMMTSEESDKVEEPISKRRKRPIQRKRVVNRKKRTTSSDIFS